MATEVENIVMHYINLFSTLRFIEIEPLVADDITAHITNAQSGTDIVNGKENFIKRLLNMNIVDVKIKISISQITSIKPDLVLIMVEINAERKQKILHNFAAHLIHVQNNKIKETWMVEALPAYSDEFWK